MTIDSIRLATDTENLWDKDILPALSEYIKIPNLSIDFDPDWATHGHMQKAQQLALNWLKQHGKNDWKIHDKTLAGRTPLLLIEIPGNSEQTILMYGHLDKQPEMEGWQEDLGPWKPVIKDNKLYGRGAADDGYALFAAVAAIKALQAQAQPHGRIVILIEFSEESGSPDLLPYIEEYQDIIGTPDLIVALDSGAGDYLRLWSTTSLRGMLSCTLKVQVLTEATHSGVASGIIPSSMRIMRQLLDRLEDPNTGDIRLTELNTDIPLQRQQQAEVAAEILGDSILNAFGTTPNLKGVNNKPAELLLNSTWRPTLSVTGQEGIPSLKNGGNVLRAYTTLKLSFRLPPNGDLEEAKDAIRKTLLADPPYNAEISVEFDQGGNGWDAPPLAPWLAEATKEASEHYFGHDAAYLGLGGSIPFMSMLGKRYPQAQFLITGVLGPKSNAHGPNEFLHIPYAKKITACVAHIVGRHFGSRD